MPADAAARKELQDLGARVRALEALLETLFQRLSEIQLTNPPSHTAGTSAESPAPG